MYYVISLDTRRPACSRRPLLRSTRSRLTLCRPTCPTILSLTDCSEYVISSDSCRTACWCHLLLRPPTEYASSRPILAEQSADAIFHMPTECTWYRLIPAAQHANVVFSFSCLHIVCDLVRYLQNSMLTPSACREYVSCLILSEQYAHAVFSFACLQIVRDIVRYLLQNSILTPSSPSPAYRWSAVSSDACRTACWCCLLPCTACTWSYSVPAEQYTHALFFACMPGSTWSDLILAEQYAHATFFFACLQSVRDLVRHFADQHAPSPAYRWCVISSDTCRTAYSHPTRELGYL